MRYFSNELKKEMRIGMGKKKDKKKNKKKKENIDMSIKKKVYRREKCIVICTCQHNK